jgi:prepilin-type N-terminal cleavage/methylation domain-containing protein
MKDKNNSERKKLFLQHFSPLASQPATPLGFSLVEYMLVMAIFLILAGLGTINLSGAKQRASLSTTVDTLVSDLRGQQLKAMVGDTEGSGSGSASNYGIHFGTSDYTLFRGSYGTGNFVVNLGDQIQVGTPGTEVLFTKGTGEIGGTFQVTLKDVSNASSKTITLNRYGVVTAIN